PDRPRPHTSTCPARHTHAEQLPSSHHLILSEMPDQPVTPRRNQLYKALDAKTAARHTAAPGIASFHRPATRLILSTKANKGEISGRQVISIEAAGHRRV